MKRFAAVLRAGTVLAAAAALVAGSGCASQPPEPPASDEILFINARVWTMAPEPFRPRAQAVALRGERIVSVGGVKQARAALGAAAQVFDLRGATILPGFVDAHIHLLAVGEKLLRRAGGAPLLVDLSSATSARQAAELAAAHGRAFPDERWVLGYGWNQETWPGRPLPAAALLDTFLPARPMVLTRADSHAVWVNSEALRRSGIEVSTPDPPGGRILRAPRGSRPTGILLERGLEPVARLVPRLTPEQKEEAYLRAAQACLAAGITSVQVAGSFHRTGAVWDPSEEEVEDRRILRDLLEKQRLPLRVSWMGLAPGDGSERVLARGAVRGGLGGRWDEAAIKVFVDGALGSRGAALLQDYADDRGNRGILRTHERPLRDLARRSLGQGIQVCAHAIGSRAVREALDAFESAADGNPGRLRQARFRIEHASAIHPDDLPRFAQLGVIASVQPSFISPDSGESARTMEERRLGPAAPERIYPFRSLLAGGARLCGSTDAFESRVSVLEGIEAAVTRGGWEVQERLKVTEAMALFTREAAWAGFLEERVGTLEPGKFADLVILAADPMAVRSDAISEIEVLATVAGGKIVHGAERIEPLRVREPAGGSAPPGTKP